MLDITGGEGVSEEAAYREICWRCWRPKAACLCPREPPMGTRTRIVLLMHRKEYRYQRTGTGRMATLHLANSELIPGVAFDDVPRVRQLIDDPGTYPVLLYPSPGALDLSEQGQGDRPGPGAAALAEAMGDRKLVVFLVDATWRCSHAVLRESPGVAALPKIQFRSSERSRWIIKRQPRDYCLSTIEAIHELLRALEAAGLDSYPDKERMLKAFASMQEYQIERRSADRTPRHLGSSRAAST